MAKPFIEKTPIRVEIESLAHDGRGVAKIDGKVVFIEEALIGEIVECIYQKNHKDYAEATTIKVLKAAPERVTPNCPHYGICGGCSFQHVDSKNQIEFKQQLVIEQLYRIGKVQVTDYWLPLTDQAWNYRTKARMGVKYVEKKARVLVGFRERRQTFLAEMNSCQIMHPLIGNHLPELAHLISQLSIKSCIPQIEVAIGDQNDCILAIRTLKPATIEDQQLLIQFANQYQICIALQPKGVDSIHPLMNEKLLTPAYHLPEFNLRFEFKPAMFTQVNYAINRQMIQQAINALELNQKDNVLDLFCGLGNFTLPLATRAAKVIGIEGDNVLIQQAQHNAQLNQINNAEFYVADLTKPLIGNWVNQRYSKLLLDPSRAGADKVLPYLAQWQPEKIIYVSCNPSTLARDAGILVNDLGYRLIKVGVMDMFPQTAHVESMALFEK